MSGFLASAREPPPPSTPSTPCPGLFFHNSGGPREPLRSRGPTKSKTMSAGQRSPATLSESLENATLSEQKELLDCLENKLEVVRDRVRSVAGGWANGLY